MIQATRKVTPRELQRSARALAGALTLAWITLLGTHCLGQAQPPKVPPTPEYVATNYTAMKKLLQRYYDQGKLSANLTLVHHRFVWSPGFYEMDENCGNIPADVILGQYDPDKSGPDYDIATVAAWVVTWENDFHTIGYPENLWKPIVEEYEKQALQDIVTPPGDDTVEVDWRGRLITTLNRYRHDSNPSLPRLADTADGCGAGDNILQVSSDPKGARIYFTMLFYHDLCQAKGIDPLDLAKCANWQEVDDSGKSLVSGQYYYLVRWPDGSIKSGPFDADRQFFQLSNTAAIFHQRQTQAVTFHQ